MKPHQTNPSRSKYFIFIAMFFVAASIAMAQDGFTLIDPPYFMESRTSYARIAWSPEAVAVMQEAKGFRVTTDGGDTWSKWHLFGKYIEDVHIISPSEILVLYLDYYVWGSNRASILARTTDAGETWIPIDTLSAWNSSIIATHDSVLVHIGTMGYTYNIVSHTLSEIPAELPAASNMVRDKNGNLFTAYSGIHRSVDEGKTWKTLWSPWSVLTEYQIALGDEGVFVEFWDYAGMMVLRYDLPTGRTDTVLHEQDRTQSFGTLVHNPYSETSYLIGDRLLEYDKGSKSYVSASVEFPVPYTVPSTMRIDSNSTWHIITNDGRYYTLQDGETEPVLRSDFFRSFFGSYGQSNPLVIHSPGDSLALFYQNNMYLSSDDGLTWGLATTAVSGVTAACWTDYGEILFASPGTFHEFLPRYGNLRTYYHFAYSDVHFELDFNRILGWNNSSYSGEFVEMYSSAMVIRTLQAPGSYIRSIEMLDEQTFLVVSDSGTIDREDAHIYIGDGTLNNWQEISSTTSARFLNVRSDAFGHIYALYPGHLEKTTNRGNSWETVRTATDDFLDYTHMFDMNSNGDLVFLDQPLRNQYVPINSGLHIYNNATQKWSFLPINMEFVRPISIDLTDDGYVYLLTDHGLLKSDHDVVTAVKQLGIAALRFTLHQNYPNPFNPTTAISFAISRPGDAVLNVYDLHGRIVKQHNLSGLQPGSHTIQLDMTGLPAGMYVYSLVADGERQSRKMLLVK